ncbi:putative ribonuclease H-like domain-containing protein [Tanacetum coccineum]
MNKPEVETMSIDDLYNNFKIIEKKVKKSVGGSSGAQNMAFMTAPSTNSTNDVNTAFPQVSTTNTNVNATSPQVSTTSVSDNIVYAFMVENPNGSNVLHQDLEQIHEDEFGYNGLKWIKTTPGKQGNNKTNLSRQSLAIDDVDSEFDMKNIIPKESLTCLVAKATLNESMLWHRRLGHINFKNINKLVKENLVRGLPLKRFKNDQTCVACLKGKQHRASCKSKVLNPITKPLFMLHMDLFGPTFMSSLMHKKYCLVITDDYSRFTWVFFLATKDETSKILKNFIKEIENLVDKKVKIIRCDNGTEFKNKVMDDFFKEKEVQRLKRKGQDFEAKLAKRQRTEEVSESVQEQTDEEPKTEELSQEKLHQLMIIVPKEGIHVEALQTKYPIIEEDLLKLWSLVQDRFNSSGLTDDKEKELWVELKMLFEPDEETHLELQRYMHDPLKWWLYDMCVVHHVSTKRGQDIFMLVEMDYPLIKGLAKIYNIANRTRQ